ncbi:hypothetical protein QVD17_14116 [Tagetes erecta]|uniref:Uncharacterized protein n=1 Tax=Tagetes erecta TaxID=13708 RepID=A0AAD8KXU0_TARER|nr:hypothetical protein QVD17_14116 [Tagetes erecta]
MAELPFDLNRSPPLSPEPEPPNRDPGKQPATAINEPIQEQEVVEVPGLIDIVVLKDMIEYQRALGMYPFEDQHRMQAYSSHWKRFGYGNAAGWKVKIEELRNKYKDHTGGVDEIDPRQKAEFIMWDMVFGNKGN